MLSISDVNWQDETELINASCCNCCVALLCSASARGLSSSPAESIDRKHCCILPIAILTNNFVYSKDFQSMAAVQRSTRLRRHSMPVFIILQMSWFICSILNEHLTCSIQKSSLLSTLQLITHFLCAPNEGCHKKRSITFMVKARSSSNQFPLFSIIILQLRARPSQWLTRLYGRIRPCLVRVRMKCKSRNLIPGRRIYIQMLFKMGMEQHCRSWSAPLPKLRTVLLRNQGSNLRLSSLRTHGKVVDALFGYHFLTLRMVIFDGRK